MEKLKDLQPETSSYLESDEFLENEEMRESDILPGGLEHREANITTENLTQTELQIQTYKQSLKSLQNLRPFIEGEVILRGGDEGRDYLSDVNKILESDNSAFGVEISNVLNDFDGIRYSCFNENLTYDHFYYDPMEDASFESFEGNYQDEDPSAENFKDPTNLLDWGLDEDTMRQKNLQAYHSQQESLRNSFPELSKFEHIEIISKDAAGGYVDGKLVAISDDKGRVTSLEANNDRNGFNLTEDEKLILKSIKSSALKENLWDDRLLLDAASLDAQLKFIKWTMSSPKEINSDIFVTAIALSLGVNEVEKRSSFVNSFITLEFGDDFGDRLINISKKIETDDLLKLSEIITKYRAESKYLSAWFGSIDPNLQKSINLAINERMTETIALLEKVVTDGQVEVDISPNEGRRHPDQEKDSRFETKWTSVEQVLMPIQAQLEGMEMAGNILRDSKNVIWESVKPGQGFQIYRLHSDDYGQALIYTREYGSGRFDKEFEYGNYSGVEARVSMSVNPKDPYHISLKDPDALRVFGVDREGRTINQAPDDPMRSPINEQGIVSFDTGSIGGEKDSLVFKIGSVFAAGNAIRSKELGNAVSLNHNTSYFDQQTWGKANKFAEFVHSINSVLDKAIEQQDKNAVNRVIKRLEQLFKGKKPPKKAA